MSQLYHIHIKVKDIRGDEWMQLQNVIGEEWCNEDPYMDSVEHVFSTGGESTLCGGESPDEFLVRLSAAVWEHLGRFVEIEIGVIYVEQAPTDSFTAEKEDYEKWLTKKSSSTSST